MITRSPVKTSKSRSLSGVPIAKRAPTPLRSTPVANATTSILTSSTATGSTTTPHEAMVASQLAHINDLVQNNRALEQTIKKLNDDLSRSAADILALNTERKSWEVDRNTWTSERQKWMDERKAWAEGCDTMQAFHRIQQHRVACALHDERVAVLKMQEAARHEQLKRLQRDYKITMFQAREAELEERIGEVEQVRDEVMEARVHNEKVAQEFEARSTALAIEVKSRTAEAQAAHKRCEKVEDDLRRLKEAHADATATSTATSSKLTRLTTERNTLDTQVTSLKRSLELAQDETTQLRTQLANWQDLKKGEDADAEEVRKKKAEVEQDLREAKKCIGELETRTREVNALQAKVQKQKERLEQCKGILQEWQTEVREQTEARETSDTQLTDAKVQIISLEQKIVELQAQLSLASRPKPPSKQPRAPDPVHSEEEVVLSPPTSTLPAKGKEKSNKPASTSKPSSSRPADAPAKPRPKPRLVKKLDPIPESQDSDLEVLDSPPVASAAPERSTKAKGKQKVVHEDSNGSDVEAREGEKHKSNEKTKHADRETEGKDTTSVKPVKRKKTSSSDDVDGTPPKAKVKKTSKKHASPDPPKKSKPSSSQPKEVSRDTAHVDADMDIAPKKKKRKINLFGTSQPSTFDWNSMAPNGSEDLGIPRQLSPMKDTDVVPRRLGRASKG